MIKKSILLLSAFFGAVLPALAQHCASDEVNSQLKKKYPVIQQYQDQLEQEYRMHMLAKQLAASVSSQKIYPYTPTKDSAYPSVYIPVAVHIVHDYGTEYVSDNEVYEWIKKMNQTFLKKNADTSSVIPTFKPYIGNPRIQLVLAGKDPLGNPTTGITRRQSYLTSGGDDQGKLDLWPPNRYLNIWLVRRVGRGVSGGVVAAYATFPSTAGAFPYYDGVIGGTNFMTSNKTYEHEVGHCLNLFHPWNNSGQSVGLSCGDDEVDDTPPTKGHFSSGPGGPATGGNCGLPVVLYDSTCANGYYKTFNTVVGSQIRVDTADYPDTTNVQNIMDYADCPIMFTHQQVDRMRSALKSTVGNRNTLIDPFNWEVTGIVNANNGLLANKPDLKPVADYSVEKVVGLSNERSYFLCAGGSRKFNFKNQSWRDTITSVQWTFSNNANPATASTNNVSIDVPEAGHGWIKTTLKVTSNAGDSTIERTDVYAADPNYTLQPGYFQEFSNNTDNEKWPIFNYYNNMFKWQLSNTHGFYDQSCIVYKGYDSRTSIDIFTGAPAVWSPTTTGLKLTGDVDDFFTPAFDLSSLSSGICNLNFMYAGVWRTSNAALMNDSLEIAYSIDCGVNWNRFSVLTKGDLMRGSQAIPFAPLSMNDWDLKSINVPNAARQSKVFFRFRYKPASDNATFGEIGVGNNYYIDRINISPFPAGVNTLVGKDHNIAIAPNPTNSNAYVVIKGNMGANTTIVVTDITGKVVYRTEEVLQQNISRVEIPANALLSKGMYLVNVVSGTQTKTEKLVVN
ncbi:hypothetical protein CAP35_10335 [Chitinophagaceae bacterium IBVUCB1]|nr:hypothetical protein CAP35_10335 [Chitinophagaceae bacterium IBVUCB1]